LVFNSLLFNSDVIAVSLKVTGGPIIAVIDYAHPDPLAGKPGIDFVIENNVVAGDIVTAVTPPANFGAECYMTDKTKTKKWPGTPVKAVITNGDAGLPGSNATLLLQGTVKFGMLLPADCLSITNICCRVYAPTVPGPSINYVETNLADNTACTTVPITKNCKPGENNCA
jgi:hypothetical protein